MKSRFEKLEKLAKRNEERLKIPGILPLIPLRSEIVVFPRMVVPIHVLRESSLVALEAAAENYDQLLFVTNQKDFSHEQPSFEDVDLIGTVCRILQLARFPDGSFKVLLEGIKRAEALQMVKANPFLVKVKVMSTRLRMTKKTEALVRRVKDGFLRYATYTQKFSKETISAFEEMSRPDEISDFVASVLPMDFRTRRKLLETSRVSERLSALLSILAHEIEILEIEHKLDSQVKEKIEKTQKEYFLREKLKAIREELGGEDSEIANLKSKITSSKLPKYAESKALLEIERLEKMSPHSAEATVIRTYLDWILSLPWNRTTRDFNDINSARNTLNKRHYGLNEAKERILEFLAVRKHSSSVRAPILCLVGPPGVGKTSLAESVAQSLHRKFEHMSLGGLRDEAEIKGHRKTYVGAMPGRIIQLLRKCQTRNPVLLLDEIDKLSSGFHGDPASSLLEALDPEQNKEFVDHYIEIPFDLSDVLFITTANTVHTIPSALLDRMEVIEIPGYTDYEKRIIARNYILPKLFSEYTMDKSKVKITPPALKKIIQNYTKEAGVRQLSRALDRVVRKTILKQEQGKKVKTIGVKDLTDLLDEESLNHNEILLDKPEIGMVQGLAWTPYGGTVIVVEALPVPGKGQLILTGQLGDIMKESARIALSLSRRICGQKCADSFECNDLHINVPEGAIPKDGPSAGVTMTVALVSAVLKQPVKHDVAMTGEVTLRGKIMPVGGIREKVLAAYRNNIEIVLLPKGNEAALKKLPKEVLKNLEFIFISNVDEAIEVSLCS